jgi:hypothetical protein
MIPVRTAQFGSRDEVLLSMMSNRQGATVVSRRISPSSNVCNSPFKSQFSATFHP